MVFIMRPSSYPFEISICFGLQWMSLSNLFLNKFWNFWFFIWVLILRPKWFQVTSYPCQLIKYFSAKSKYHQIYSKILRKICKKKFKSHFHQSGIKCFFFFINIFWIYMIQTFLKIICWQSIVPYPERLLISSATSMYETWNTSAFPILVYYNINRFFPRSFSFMHWSVQFIYQNFKCFWA